MKIQYKAVSSLIAYEKNARTHSDNQVTQIANSIQEFGFTNPVLIDKDGVIIAGHGRVLAAVQLGMTEVPTIVLDYLSDRQRRAYVLADNKIAMNSGWDFEMLSSEVSDLMEMNFDIDVVGFNEQEIDALLQDDNSILPPKFEEPETIEVKGHTRVVGGDAPPAETPEPTQSVAGTVWLLGDHKLVCTSTATMSATVDLIKYWQSLTGLDAVLESTGQTFNSL